MSPTFGERESVLDELALGVEVQDLVGVDELGLGLQEGHLGQHEGVEPGLKLEVP